MKIAITGANGFLGQHLVKRLVNFPIKVLGRKPLTEEIGEFHLYQLGSDQVLSSILADVDVLIHCAAKTASRYSQQDQAQFKQINVDATLNLAQQALQAGVKRFIFISSLKVNGESTSHSPFTASDLPNPQDDYAWSKQQAEQGLLKLVEQPNCPMDVVIIRPPLIYGPGCKGNFAALLALIDKGYPLPFSCIRYNRRSLVSINNLLDLIQCCLTEQRVKNQILLVSDGEDLSTYQLISLLANGLGKTARLLPLPIWCFQLLGRLTGKKEVVNRLLGSLQVDITFTQQLTDWQPKQKPIDGFKQTAQAYLQNKK